MRKPRALNPPARIFLVAGDLDRDVEFDELADVHWCSERQYDADVEYRLVRPSRHKRKPVGKDGDAK